MYKRLALNHWFSTLPVEPSVYIHLQWSDYLQCVHLSVKSSVLTFHVWSIQCWQALQSERVSHAGALLACTLCISRVSHICVGWSMIYVFEMHAFCWIVTNCCGSLFTIGHWLAVSFSMITLWVPYWDQSVWPLTLLQLVFFVHVCTYVTQEEAGVNLYVMVSLIDICTWKIHDLLFSRPEFAAWPPAKFLCGRLWKKLSFPCRIPYMFAMCLCVLCT